jgi:hypothetical protein
MVQKILGPDQYLTGTHHRHNFLDDQGLAPDFPGDLTLMGEELSIDASSLLGLLEWISIVNRG